MSSICSLNKTPLLSSLVNSPWDMSIFSLSTSWTPANVSLNVIGVNWYNKMPKYIIINSTVLYRRKRRRRSYSLMKTITSANSAVSRIWTYKSLNLPYFDARQFCCIMLTWTLKEYASWYRIYSVPGWLSLAVWRCPPRTWSSLTLGLSQSDQDSIP